MKKIQVQPASEILLQISADEAYELTFNTKCIMYLQQYVQDLNKDNKLTKENYGEILPAILYAAINAKTENITRERATEIASMMGVNEGVAIMQELTDSLTSTMTPEQKKSVEKMMKTLTK